MLDQFQPQLELAEAGVKSWFDSFAPINDPAHVGLEGMRSLHEAMGYSALSGGKRVRPVLGLLLAEAWGVKPQRVLPWVVAVELVHTYSLIHDDLPCMDNDDERRGRPTSHMVFGEAGALLAGDTLLTEAFGYVAFQYEAEPEKAIRAIRLLSEAAGFWGMAGGQALDIEAQKLLPDKDLILDMHSRKTGALFRLICEGVAVFCGVHPETQAACRQFGASLGLCFQLADDILDSTPEIEKGSLPELIGVEGTRAILVSESQKALSCLETIEITQGPLVEIVKWNQSRKI